MFRRRGRRLAGQLLCCFSLVARLDIRAWDERQPFFAERRVGGGEAVDAGAVGGVAACDEGDADVAEG